MLRRDLSSVASPPAVSGGGGFFASLQGLIERAVTSVIRVPLFFWIYIGLILYLYKRVSRDWLGIGTKRKLLLNRLNVELTKEEEAISEGVIDPKDIRESFHDVGGLEDIKQSVTEHVVWPFTRPDLFPVGSLRAHPTGLLLYGPPGTGKTLVARALAKELNGFFIEVCVEKLFAKWVGESEKLAAAVFSLAAKLQPCVIFVDEIDSLLGSRSNSDSAVYTHAKTIFMTKWDGLQQGTTAASSSGAGPQQAPQRQRILVVGATNRPRTLDEAILRRMPIRLEVPLPSEAARATIVAIHLRDELRRLEPLEAERLVTGVAAATHSYSGSDLKELCKAACMVPLRHLMQASPRGVSAQSADVPPINIQHFSEALQKVKATSTF
jgi:SpoVK/Ycf46/Vps4 family AAA+-type ATPase